MRIDDTFIVKKHFNMDNGEVPCGSIIRILDLDKENNKYTVSITPYNKNGVRQTKVFIVKKEFILKYGDK